MIETAIIEQPATVQRTPANLENLPEGWSLVRLDEITQKTKQKDPRKILSGSFKYVDVSSVSNDTLSITGWDQIENASAPSRARKLLRTGDTIFATVRPRLRRIAMVPQGLDGEICSTGFCVIRPVTERADPRYVYFAATTPDFVQRVVTHQKGSSYPAVTDSQVLREQILLPPLAEQRRIARVLSTIQKAIEAQDKVIAAARELKRSLMKHLFTYGPVSITEASRVPLKETEIGPVPKHWKIEPFGKLVEVTHGQVDPRKKPYSKMLHVGPENIEPGTGRIVAPKISAEIRLISGKYLFTNEDVLYSKIRPYLRKVALPTFTGVCSADMYPLHPRGSSIMREFLFHYLLSEEFTRNAVSFQDRTGIPKINRKQLGGIPLPLPPEAEQREVAQALATVDGRIEAGESCEAALQALFKSMLHHLMTGKIRVL